jgi:hypothetical protein
MEITENQSGAGSVNYDDVPIAQEEIEGTDYRIDAGLGSAVAISRRESGSWRWAFVAEGRWDGVRLRAKGLGHPVVAPLERALARVMSERQEQGLEG